MWVKRLAQLGGVEGGGVHAWPEGAGRLKERSHRPPGWQSIVTWSALGPCGATPEVAACGTQAVLAWCVVEARGGLGGSYSTFGVTSHGPTRCDSSSAWERGAEGGDCGDRRAGAAARAWGVRGCLREPPAAARRRPPRHHNSLQRGPLAAHLTSYVGTCANAASKIQTATLLFPTGQDKDPPREHVESGCIVLKSTHFEVSKRT